jgi:pyruvate kinase
MKYSKAQIVATIGPASTKPEVLEAMLSHNLDVIRLNFSWGDFSERIQQIKMIRELEKKYSRKIPVIEDLPGPRVQEGAEHTYDPSAGEILTDADKESIKFGAEENIDYVAMSFVGSAEDIRKCKSEIKKSGGRQKVIAKIERRSALDSIDEIIEVSDAVMIARGDLGKEVRLEEIPFVQEKIIKKCKEAGKPVITATQMMLSMTENPLPTRAEVTDVANAILQGSDAVMLSEETARGKYPAEAVEMMEKIVLEAERHMAGRIEINPL